MAKIMAKILPNLDTMGPFREWAKLREEDAARGLNADCDYR
jgi:hypothetical protein